jgi:hypothetical protein
MEWEYKVIKVENISKFSETIKLQEELNNYGKEGWELVGIFYPPQIGEGWMPKLDSDSVIFKRQIKVA